ncbi:MAG TPA: hypothetical protein VF266_16140 [Thermoanaerobaculia bacterium]
MSSYANVQLFARGRNPEEIRAAALASLRASLGGSWIEVPPGEPCERVVLIGPAEEWIAVYDDDAPDPRPLAAMLSAATRAPAVSITVLDGDLLQLTIFRDGAPAADATNWPGYFRGAAPPARVQGDPAAWSDFIVPAGDDALLDAWQRGTEPEPATAVVQRMSALTRWSPQLATSGARTLTTRAGFTQLCLRRITTPAPSGAPHLDLLGGSPGVTVRTGDTVNVVVIARGSGSAPSMNVTFSGPAADFIQPRSITLTAGGHAAELTLDATGTAVVPFGPAPRVELIAAFTAVASGSGLLRIALQPVGGEEAVREIAIRID